MFVENRFLKSPKETGCLRRWTVQSVVQFAAVGYEVVEVFEQRCRFYCGIIDGIIKGFLLFARPTENPSLIRYNLEANSGEDFRSCTRALLKSISSKAHKRTVISVM